MEAERNVRRRLSATSLQSSNDNDSNEEAIELLQTRERQSSERYQDGIQAGSQRHGGLTKWLRPLGLVFSLVILAIIGLGLDSALKFISELKAPQLLTPSLPDTDIKDPALGIILHREDHVNRPPKTLIHHWDITSAIRAPDGVKKQVYLVNNLFPGPTIECRSGDRLVIHVTNSLSLEGEGEGISIHFHGLSMRGANDMDGAVGFTQCPIPPGGTFAYEFEIGVEEAGTYWWHAHSQVQRGDGMFGGLVVHKPIETGDDRKEFSYENEVLVMIGDWYHRSAGEVLTWYTSARGFGNEPVPDSLVVNGKGRFICSMAVPARPVECIDILEEQMLGLFDSKHSTPTRLRIVNTGSLAGFTLQITSGKLTPITVDGGFQIPRNASNSVGIIYPGERIDLLLDLDNASSQNSPQLQIFLDPENFKYPNSALRPNQSFPLFPNRKLQDLSDEASLESPSHFDLSTATSLHRSNIPDTANQTILLYTKTQKLSISSNHPTGYMNRTTWSPQSSPPYPLISLSRSQWDANQLIPFIPLPTTASPLWVEVIINNLDDGSHPFHLHGYSFYVLASYRSEHGWGSWNPFSRNGKEPQLNFANPVRKDTVPVPRRGYVVIRFEADNEGIWMLHCHVLFHQASGMAMGIQVGGGERWEVVDDAARMFCPGVGEDG